MHTCEACGSEYTSVWAAEYCCNPTWENNDDG